MPCMVCYILPEKHTKISAEKPIFQNLEGSIPEESKIRPEERLRADVSFRVMSGSVEDEILISASVIIGREVAKAALRYTFHSVFIHNGLVGVGLRSRVSIGDKMALGLIDLK